MINFYGLSNIFGVIANLAIAAFLYAKGRSNKLARIWATFTACVAIYSFGAFFASGAGDADAAFFWWQFSYIGVIMLPVLFIQFVYAFLDIRRPLFIKSLYAITAIILVTDVASKSLFIGNVSMQFYGYEWFKPAWWVYPPGPVHIFHTLAMYFGLLTYGLVRIILAYRRSDPVRKNQIKYFFVAMALGFYGGGSSYLGCFGVNFYPWPNIMVPLYTFIVAYAIVRHQLMDIDVIIKKTLVFAALLASVFAILLIPTFVIQEYFLRSADFAGRAIGLAISGLIIILTMRKMEDFLTDLTDKYLFQKKYDYKELLKTFTAEVLTVLNLTKLVDLTVAKLVDIVKISSCAALLFDNEKDQFSTSASYGIRDNDVTLAKVHDIVKFFEHTHGYVLIKELADQNIYVPPSAQEIIDKLNAELIIPMILHDKVMGILTLGKKKSDEDYTQDDLDILLPLSQTLAIAISNAKLFEELGKTQAEAAQKEKMAVIGTLSAGINHEICNPLGIARGQCEAFLLNTKDGLYKGKSSDELLKKAGEIMEKVIKETDRATAITKKLSSFAKPAKGEAELVDVGREVDEVFGLVGYELKLDKIEFIRHIDDNLSRVFVDRKQFQEVLFNLIRNAGQAIAEKGKVIVSAREESGKIVIEVQDSGAGIPEDKIKELFNPFFTTKDPGKGTGLGLFIVRQVVEKNRGKIYLKKTAVGEGTTFAIEFPAESGDAPEVPGRKGYEATHSRNRR